MTNIYYRVLMAVGGGMYIHLNDVFNTAEQAFASIERMRKQGKKHHYAVGKYTSTSNANAAPIEIITA